MSQYVARIALKSKKLSSFTMGSNTTTSQTTARGAAGLRVVAMGQYVHRSLEGDPDPNQCFGRAQWDVLGRLWGQTWLGLAF